MLTQEEQTDFPAYLDLDMQAFRKYKRSWLLWRTCGSFDTHGSFIPPVSFTEAMAMPKDELDTYFELDRLIAIRQKQIQQANKK